MWQDVGTMSTYKLCGDGDHHEESHTISHYNCFICVIVMSLFSTSKFIKQTTMKTQTN